MQTCPKVIVYGFPRSGTSLVTELIGILGLSKGKLNIEKSETELQGYNEHRFSMGLFHLIYVKYGIDHFVTGAYKHEHWPIVYGSVLSDYLNWNNVEVYKENHLEYSIGAFIDTFGTNTVIIHMQRNEESLYNSYKNFWRMDIQKQDFLAEKNKRETAHDKAMADYNGTLNYNRFNLEQILTNPRETMDRLCDLIGLYTDNAIVRDVKINDAIKLIDKPKF